MTIAALALGVTITARGGSFITFTGSSPSQDIAASATFSNLVGGDLEVTLVNTYTGDTVDQSHVLTGIFFDGASGLTTVSAAAGVGSVEWSGTSTIPVQSSAQLGTEWAYFYGDTVDPDGATNGIVSSGYSGYGGPGSGNFASPGDMLDGSGWGILSEGYAGSDLDGLSTRDYIQDTMVFILSGFNGNLSNISDVTFQYGTMLSGEPSVVGTPVSPVPEPETLVPAAILVALLGIKYRKHRPA
jgi:hypothetical protein